MKKLLHIFFAIFLLVNATACTSVSSDATKEVKNPADSNVAELPVKRLDLANFIGDEVYFNATYPSEITNLTVDLRFPKNHKLLVKAKPSIELYNKDMELVYKRIIDPDQLNYVVNKKIPADVLYAKLGIYYCKTGDEGLCLIQNVLYKIKTSDALKPGTLDLQYDLPES